MSESSRIKIMANALDTKDNQWWPIEQLIEQVIPGYEALPDHIKSEMTSIYGTYIPHVRDMLENKSRYLLRRGWGWKAEYKAATIKDLPFIQAHLEREFERRQNADHRIKRRVGILQEGNILPEGSIPKRLM